MNEDLTQIAQSQQIVAFQPTRRDGENMSTASTPPLLPARDETCTEIPRLNDDALLRIFELCRPGEWNQTVEVDASAILDRQAPENIYRVCRSWRDLVLSFPRLWATIELRSVNPSDVSIDAMARYMRHCLDRSRGSLLECFITLEGTFDVEHARRILMMLTEHQRRWERINIKIRPSPRSQRNGEDLRADVPGVVSVSPIELNAEDLSHLKEFQLDFIGQGRLSGPRLIDGPPPVSDIVLRLPQMRSLSILHLHTPSGLEIARWLNQTPNLETFYLTAVTLQNLNLNEILSHVDVQFATSHEHIMLTSLRTLIIGDPGRYCLAQFMQILLRLVCPELLLLDVSFPEVESEEMYQSLTAFLWFYGRLGRLRLRAMKVSDSSEREIVNIDRLVENIFHLLLCVPMLLDFTYSCRDVLLYILVEILKRTRNVTATSETTSPLASAFLALPKLENLKIVRSRVPLARLSVLIAVRWNAHGRTLKSITLWDCTTFTGEEIPSYAPGDDPACLSAEWDDVKQYIAQGLVLRIGGSATRI